MLISNVLDLTQITFELKAVGSRQYKVSFQNERGHLWMYQLVILGTGDGQAGPIKKTTLDLVPTVFDAAKIIAEYEAIVSSLKNEREDKDGQ